MISGAGGVGYQDSDWKKHNALMKDLQERSWPIVYTRDGVPLPLVYNIAYYMPAALAGRIGDNIAAQRIARIETPQLVRDQGDRYPHVRSQIGGSCMPLEPPLGGDDHVQSSTADHSEQDERNEQLDERETALLHAGQ